MKLHSKFITSINDEEKHREEKCIDLRRYLIVCVCEVASLHWARVGTMVQALSFYSPMIYDNDDDEETIFSELPTYRLLLRFWLN